MWLSNRARKVRHENHAASGVRRHHLFLIFMIVPVIATLMFSVSTRWDRTLWPEGLTLDWWKAVTSHKLFLLTLKNSF